MTISLLAALKLLRCFKDEDFAKSKARYAEPYITSRTLKEQYSYFVWEFGTQ